MERDFDFDFDVFCRTRDHEEMRDYCGMFWRRYHRRATQKAHLN